jgi:hypothetical protein
MNIKFKVTDLDLDELEKAIVLEANSIHDPNKSRTWENVYDMVTVGKPPERFLIEKGCFVDDPRKYHDNISPCGLSVESKVRNPKNVATTLVELSNHRVNPRGYLKSDWVFMWGFTGRDLQREYYLQGIYKFNGDQYVSAKFDWEEEYKVAQSLKEDYEFLKNYS